MSDSENQQPQVQVTIANPINAVSLTLGIIGVIVGVVALLGGWIPFIGLAGIPIAVTGLVLSVAGVVFAWIRKFKSIELPVLGCLICITAIGFSLFISYQTAKALAKKQAEEARIKQEAETKRLRQEQQAIAKATEERKARIAFLQLQITDLSSQISDASQAVIAAQTNYDSAIANQQHFLETKPYLTNAVYVKISRQRDAWMMQRAANEQATGMSGYSAPAYDDRLRDAYISAQVDSAQTARQNIVILDKNIANANQQMNNIVITAEQFYAEKVKKTLNELKAQQKALENLQADLKAKNTELEYLSARL